MPRSSAAQRTSIPAGTRGGSVSGSVKHAPAELIAARLLRLPVILVAPQSRFSSRRSAPRTRLRESVDKQLETGREVRRCAAGDAALSLCSQIAAGRAGGNWVRLFQIYNTYVDVGGRNRRFWGRAREHHDSRGELGGA